MDGLDIGWNNAPACVLSTVWGTASIRDLAVEVGAVPASPNRQCLTGQSAQAAVGGAGQPVDLWTSQTACPQTHRRNNKNRLQSIRNLAALGPRPAAFATRTPPRSVTAARATCRHLCADPDSRSHTHKFECGSGASSTTPRPDHTANALGIRAKHRSLQWKLRPLKISP
jgi:hypothetical protein